MITQLDFRQNDIIIVFEEIESDIIDDYQLVHRFDTSKFYLNEIKSKNEQKNDSI